MSALAYAIQCYRAIPEVVAIYHDADLLWIFTSNEQYDDKLMDRLLDIELELDQWRLDQFIEYTPTVLGEPTMIVSEMAVCDYRRTEMAS